MFTVSVPATRPRPGVAFPPCARQWVRCRRLAVIWTRSRRDTAAAYGRSPLSLPRHLGFYLAHVACGLPLRAVARLSACHPSSIAYGVRRIEHLRENAALDGAIARLEAAARGLGPRGLH
ncbi:MAG: hypothetical protein AB1592_05925 [Pseudomonadota bacterium]